MEFINLTPHAINIVDEQGNIVRTFAPIGTVARCDSREERQPDIDGTPIVRQKFGAIEGLPPAKKGIAYIVSMVVGNAVANGTASPRSDIYGPNTSPGAVKRNAEGHIVGVKSLVQY